MAPATAAVIPDQEGTFSMGSSHTLDQLDTCFDDTHAVANAGLLLAPTLDKALGTLATLGPLPTVTPVALDAAYDSDTTRTALAERDLGGQTATKAPQPRSRQPAGGRWSAPTPGATSSASCAGEPNAPGRSWSSGSTWPRRSSRWAGCSAR